jgi:UDP-N-acetylmuramoyl-L-alanyl-D-glutamate--2,6-diaminopimelate ligase
LQEQGALPVLIETGLIGEFNVANLLAVIGGLRALGQTLASIAAVIGRVTPVPGRMQRVGNGQDLPQVVVDYAHTPDALEKALTALKPLTAARGGDLHCLFGCGGNRDQAKRPLMGAIAARLADRVTLTSDNPRREDPAAIITAIAAGLPVASNFSAEPDRRAAILHAVLGADRRDVLLLAGKGHEDYQESAGLRRHFSDLEESRQALLSRAGL